MAQELRQTRDLYSAQIAKLQRKVDLQADRSFRHYYNEEYDARARSFITFLDGIDQHFSAGNDDDGFNDMVTSGQLYYKIVY